jgi:hypothetical protein
MRSRIGSAANSLGRSACSWPGIASPSSLERRILANALWAQVGSCTQQRRLRHRSARVLTGTAWTEVRSWYKHRRSSPTDSSYCGCVAAAICTWRRWRFLGAAYLTAPACDVSHLEAHGGRQWSGAEHRPRILTGTPHRPTSRPLCGGHSSVGRAPGCGLGCHGFESRCSPHPWTETRSGRKRCRRRLLDDRYGRCRFLRGTAGPASRSSMIDTGRLRPAPSSGRGGGVRMGA